MNVSPQVSVPRSNRGLFSHAFSPIPEQRGQTHRGRFWRQGHRQSRQLWKQEAVRPLDSSQIGLKASQASGAEQGLCKYSVYFVHIIMSGVFFQMCYVGSREEFCSGGIYISSLLCSLWIQ